MKETIRISDAEWQVMKIIWNKAPVTSSEILEELKPVTKWSTTTIYTLINRLVKKKAIAVEKGSSPYVCRPLVDQKDLRREERTSFLKRVYDGSLNLMVANMVEEGLSDEEIDELKDILERSRDRRK